MHPTRLLAAFAPFALAALLAQAHFKAAAAEPAEAQTALFADAATAFRARNYAAAYGRFARLADAGHFASAQLALVMVDQGRTLFGSDWSASPDQRRRWNALVVDALRRRVEGDDGRAE
jgi:hypothetical protein